MKLREMLGKTVWYILSRNMKADDGFESFLK